MKAVALKNITIEGPGLLGDLLLDSGWELEIIDLYAGEPAPKNLSGIDMLIVLGGPMNVYETEKYPFLRNELELIEEGYRKDIPVIGFCLGSQLMAVALGAEVKKNPAKELGWYDIALTEEGKSHPLFEDMPESFPIFQWHGDTFNIPVGAKHLATSELCRNQCFSYGNSLAMQFHPEVKKSDIYDWVDAYSEELTAEMGPDAANRIKEETENIYTGSRMMAEKLLRKLLLCE